MNKVKQQQTGNKYAETLIQQTKMRWGILVSALSSGHGYTAKLDHMDVLEANDNQIVVGDKSSGSVNMTFKKEEILKQGVPQITDFEIIYFNDKGVKIESANPPDMSPKGARPSKHRGDRDWGLD